MTAVLVCMGNMIDLADATYRIDTERDCVNCFGTTFSKAKTETE